MPRRHPRPDPKPKPSLDAARRRALRKERRRRKSPPRPDPGILMPAEIEEMEADLRLLRQIKNPSQKTLLQIRNINQELRFDRDLRKRSRASSSERIR